MKKIIALLVLLASNALAGDLTGKWSGTFKVDGGDHTVPQLFILKQQGNKLTGTGGPNSGEQYPVENGRVEDSRVTFEVTTGNWKFAYDLKVSNEKMSGDLKLKAMNDSRAATVTLTKAE